MCFVNVYQKKSQFICTVKMTYIVLYGQRLKNIFKPTLVLWGKAIPF